MQPMMTLAEITLPRGLQDIPSSYFEMKQGGYRSVYQDFVLPDGTTDNFLKLRPHPKELRHPKTDMPDKSEKESRRAGHKPLARATRAMRLTQEPSDK